MNFKFDYNNKTNSIPKKVKHYNGFEFENYNILSSKNVNIEDESFLLLPSVSSKQKSQVILKETLHPQDYLTDLKSNKMRGSVHFTSYYGNHHGPGKGFGNSDMNNVIRNGESSRVDNDMFNINIEKNINSRQDILFKNYQNPKNLILPFPRGGEITRKTHINQEDDMTSSNKFSFKY